MGHRNSGGHFDEEWSAYLDAAAIAVLLEHYAHEWRVGALTLGELLAQLNALGAFSARVQLRGWPWLDQVRWAEVRWDAA